jgi:hypothetical protein
MYVLPELLLDVAPEVPVAVLEDDGELELAEPLLLAGVAFVRMNEPDDIDEREDDVPEVVLDVLLPLVPTAPPASPFSRHPTTLIVLLELDELGWLLLLDPVWAATIPAQPSAAANAAVAFVNFIGPSFIWHDTLVQVGRHAVSSAEYMICRSWMREHEHLSVSRHNSAVNLVETTTRSSVQSLSCERQHAIGKPVACLSPLATHTSRTDCRTLPTDRDADVGAPEIETW